MKDVQISDARAGWYRRQRMRLLHGLTELLLQPLLGSHGLCTAKIQHGDIMWKVLAGKN